MCCTSLLACMSLSAASSCKSIIAVHVNSLINVALAYSQGTRQEMKDCALSDIPRNMLRLCLTSLDQGDGVMQKPAQQHVPNRQTFDLSKSVSSRQGRGHSGGCIATNMVTFRRVAACITSQRCCAGNGR